MIHLSQQVQNELDIIRKGRVYQIPEERFKRMENSTKTY